MTVKRGSTVVKRGVAVVNGRASITLTSQPAGSQRYTVSYSGTARVLSSGAAVTVAVRR